MAAKKRATPKKAPCISSSEVGVSLEQPACERLCAPSRAFRKLLV